MSTATLDGPVTVPAPADANELPELHHWVCCDYNTALCGTDVTNDRWVTCDITCPVCATFRRCPDCGGEL